MAHKNGCSGCNLNFATMDSFTHHRVGRFGEDRRCLSAQEMAARGWKSSSPLVTFYRDGKPYRLPTPTWEKPISEKKQAFYANNKSQRKAA